MEQIEYKCVNIENRIESLINLLEGSMKET